MIVNRILLPAAALAAVGLATLAPAAHAVVLIEPTTNGTTLTASAGTFYGYQFSLSSGQTYTVNDLAYYLPSGTPTVDQTVYLTDGSGNVLASATINSSSTAVTDPVTGSNFYETSIAPVALADNTAYYVLATDNDNVAEYASAFSGTSVTANQPNLSYVYSASTTTTPSGTTFTGITTNASGTNGGYFGPSLDGTLVSAAPEPSGVGMIALLGLGLGGLVLRARRTQSVSVAA